MQKDKSPETIIVIMLGLIAVYWVRRAGIFLGAAALLGIASLLVPGLSQFVHRAWMSLSRALGVVSGTILLTLVYVLILLPLSFFSRMSGRTSLKLKKGGPSYFRERAHTYTKEDLINPW
ncbi:MAG: SxtJ family membrane protein [Bacteroidota bacterium]|nr:SxtJ family membrane protein [Bacteroidota bacterium]MDP4218548.1 SxtJ family membrane protein [Bacteroidota bacterium]MDP4255120.1 SxtJ family membrane protein [Bacteroidota bacterium]MDP4258553.1 SxtJ family membrane protein [Bacteroidota bacterium]